MILMKCKENKDRESFVKYESHRKGHKKDVQFWLIKFQR